MDANTIIKTCDELIYNIDQLLDDLNVNNPLYRTAFDVGDNPVISLISQALNRVPTYFAEPVGEGVKFNIDKIKEARKQISKIKSKYTEFNQPY